MVLSKREKYVFFGTLAAVSLLAVDRMAIQPLFNQRDAMMSKRDKLAGELRSADKVMAEHRRLGGQWQDMLRSGMKSDSDEAVDQVRRSIYAWAGDTGVTVSLVKPESLTEKSRLPRAGVQVTGTGRMEAVARLLYRVQTASIPIKITEVQLSSRKEGTDDLNMQFRISTLYAPGQSASAPAVAAAPGPMRPPRTRRPPASSPPRVSASEPAPSTAPAGATMPATSTAPAPAPALDDEEPAPDEAADDPGDTP